MINIKGVIACSLSMAALYWITDDRIFAALGIFVAWMPAILHEE